MLFREASIQQRLVNLRAADDLGRYVRLVSGRIPKPCHPAHCEVLRLQGKGPIPSTSHLRLIEVGRAVLKSGRAVCAVRAAGAADRDGCAGHPLPHPAAVADRDRERGRGPLEQHRAADLLPLVRLVRPDPGRRRASLGDRRVPQQGAAPDRGDRGQLGRVPGDRADRRARHSRIVVDGCRTPAVAPRRRRRGVAPRVHDPRRSCASARRHRRPPPTGLVRGTPLAGRAAHARGVAVTRSGRNRCRLDARRSGRRLRRVARRLTGQRRARARTSLARRPARCRRLSRSPPACCSTRRCARLPCTSGGWRSRRSTPRRSARSPSSSSAGRAAPSIRSS